MSLLGRVAVAVGVMVSRSLPACKRKRGLVVAQRGGQRDPHRAFILNRSLTAPSYLAGVMACALRGLLRRNDPDRFQPPSVPRDRRQRPHAAYRPDAAARLRRTR